MHESVKQFDIDNGGLDEAILHNGWLYFPTGNIRSNSNPSHQAIMYRPQKVLERMGNQLMYERTRTQLAYSNFHDLKSKFIQQARNSVSTGMPPETPASKAYKQLEELKEIYQDRKSRYDEVERQYEQLPEVREQRRAEAGIHAQKQESSAYLMALQAIR
ncbi:hypothetical protein Pan44_25050 [Caulifigura coniformis]|uniref:Uncharacterized protein n=1 Tax=Caulifigura coniformis TaxID=2527983 RepID=A0A517SEC2_9PLAN|nr:hypothetical protein [Caulifigura coniformis]QDT54472.1 hypothetical protein Pan44_25050 [Caulifigura coniformis]